MVLPVGQGLSDQYEKSEVFLTPNFTSPVKSLLLTIFNAALTKKPHMHTPTCLFLHFAFLVMLTLDLEKVTIPQRKISANMKTIMKQNEK